MSSKAFDRSSKVEELINWASRQNIQLANCGVKFNEGLDGAGLYATADIDDEKPFIIVPNDCLVTRSNIFKLARNEEFLRDLLFRKLDGSTVDIETDESLKASGFNLDDVSTYGDFPLKDRDIITRYFIFEILTSRRGGLKEKSLFTKWHTWIQSLPPLNEMNLPFTWEEYELNTIFGTSIFEAVISKIEVLKFRYSRFFSDEDLREKIKNYVKSGPSPTINIESDIEVTFQDWLLIESWISSRSLEVFDTPVQDYSDANNTNEMLKFQPLRLGLVPIIDLCNHSETNWNAKYELDPASGSVSLIPVKPIKKGEQIYITYGEDKGAGEMLFSYGFIPTVVTDKGEKKKRAKAAQFSIPPLIDEDEEGEEEKKQPSDKKKEEEDDSMILLKAKHNMFGKRPRLFKVYAEENGDGELVSWESDYVTLLSLPASEFTFKREAKDNEEEPDSILFRNKKIDLNNIKESLKSVISMNDKILDQANDLAENLVKNVFEVELGEIERRDKESDKNVRHEAHELIELEKELLSKLKF